jgi:hypothetical protein
MFVESKPTPTAIGPHGPGRAIPPNAVETVLNTPRAANPIEAKCAQNETVLTGEGGTTTGEGGTTTGETGSDILILLKIIF